MGDWLDDEVPIAWLAELLQKIAETPFLDWQLLTKRIELWSDRLQAVAASDNKVATTMAVNWLAGNPPSNVGLGVSVENQRCADERIPLLLRTPTKMRFLSCEPLLEEINILKLLPTFSDPDGTCGFEPNQLHWAIIGGESGSKDSRIFDLDWGRSLIGQCRTAGIYPFLKQAGSNPVDKRIPIKLRDKKGADLYELPIELQVQEIPQ